MPFIGCVLGKCKVNGDPFKNMHPPNRYATPPLTEMICAMTEEASEEVTKKRGLQHLPASRSGSFKIVDERTFRPALTEDYW